MYLGQFVQEQTGRKMIFWQGYCPVHARLLPEYVAQARAAHPNAEVLVHPECMPATVHAADNALSTTGMCRYVKNSPCNEFVIGTEVNIIHRLKKENPDKTFYPLTERACCENMKKNSAEKVLTALQEMKNVVTVAEPVRSKAYNAIKQMLDYSRTD
jgi:quinolinate synthase